MGKKLSTYYALDGVDGSKCEVHFDFKEEYAYIKYFDKNENVFFTEEFRNKSLHYVNDAAENWSTGLKKIEGNTQRALL